MPNTSSFVSHMTVADMTLDIMVSMATLVSRKQMNVIWIGIELTHNFLSLQGYIYSETYAADLFSKFNAISADGNKSVVDIGLGKKYREKILSPCATLNGEVMLLQFLGREPTKDAFLGRISKA